MVASNTYGRQVVLVLTNKSGGSVAAGDVVIVDTANNDAFTTTTTAGFTGLVGVAQETIASNATGRVLVSGYAALINVNASVTRGQYGKTHTVAKQATGTASRGPGTFCQWLTGGTTPDAVVYPVDLLGTSLTNPMTTTGDVIYSSDNSGTPARLAAGAIGTVLRSGGAGVVPAWAAGGVAIATAAGSGSADYTTTSASYADVDGTNLVITPTNAQTGDILEIMCLFGGGSSGAILSGLTFGIAGTDVGDTNGLVAWTSSNNIWTTMFYLYTMPSSSQPAIKLRWKTASGTATMYNRTTHARPRMSVKNLSRGGTL